MKSLVQWAIQNSPAMNMMMIAILVVGSLSLVLMRREVFPEFELEVILVSVPYPGASPEEVEEGICQKIEEAVQGIDNIKKVTSVAAEGSGSVVLELDANVKDVQKVLSEVRSEVDRIPSFPVLAEDEEIKQITMRQPAIRVAVVASEDADVDEIQLRALAEEVRDELLELPSISQVDLQGARDYQIDIEVEEETLRKYGLTLQQIAQIVRRENLELPGGKILAEGQEILLRGKNKRMVGQELEKLPLLTDPSGVVLTVGDLATVQDDFADTVAIHRVNGRPAIVLQILRTSDEDLLKITEEVHGYVASRELPSGYQLKTWGDRSIDVEDRLNMLIDNGVMGLCLVFIVLALFLELKLAFWVAMGIPISMLGAGSLLLVGDQTLNMLSMFAFLMALGIIVDDAIVVGENIYSHREMGKGFVRAAIEGTAEVVPSVTASVTTTIIAFGPLLFVSGIMGKFIAVLPFAVIAMLVLSLLESIFILPCHLAHKEGYFFVILKAVLYPLKPLALCFRWLNLRMTAALDWFIQTIYLTLLRFSLNNTGIVVGAAIALLLVMVGFVGAGIVPFTIFPKLDSKVIQAKLIFPDGTPSAVTNQATLQLEDSLWRLNEELKQEFDTERDFVAVSYRRVGSMPSGEGGGAAGANESSGGHLGMVEVELLPPEQRNISSEEILKRWRAACPEFPGLESSSFAAEQIGPAGTPIEFKLLASTEQFEALESAVERCKAKLATFPGVFDIEDDSRPGKWEYQIRLKDRASSLGLTNSDLAETIRASYYGEEVMRLQRGRHEVKLMVRYPKEDRKSLARFDNIRVRTNDGAERPLTEVADVTVKRGYSEINRIDQKRSITISADLDETKANASEIVSALKADFMPELLSEYPGVGVRWEGQQEQTEESLNSLLMGTVVALLLMYILLTFEFTSYFQPLLILAIIPFGIVGAVLGHAIMGLPLTLFSFFGLVALTGVVVNDSIVLIDFINHRVRDGLPIEEALLDAGRRRFRPVLLTSLTTLAGLFPILMETSFQAQILIPMATSLSFGLLLATVLVLVLVPVFYKIYRWLSDLLPAEHEWEERIELPPEVTSMHGSDAAAS